MSSRDGFRVYIVLGRDGNPNRKQTQDEMQTRGFQGHVKFQRLGTCWVFVGNNGGYRRHAFLHALHSTSKQKQPQFVNAFHNSHMIAARSLV